MPPLYRFTELDYWKYAKSVAVAGARLKDLLLALVEDESQVDGRDVGEAILELEELLSVAFDLPDYVIEPPDEIPF